MSGQLQACCARLENRSEPREVREGLTVQLCRACGRRHFELVAEPGLLAVRSAEPARP